MNAKLIEPSGTPYLVTSMDDAIKFCKMHPGWSWETTEEDAVPMPQDDPSGNLPAPILPVDTTSKAPNRPGPDRCEDHNMPFGKHRGKALAQILVDEPSYLDWLNTKAELRDGSLRDAVKEMNDKYAPEIEKGVEEKREAFFADKRRRYSGD